MKRKSTAWVLGLGLCGMAWLGLDGGKKPLKGSVYSEASLDAETPEMDVCRVDSGTGTVAVLAWTVENPLFAASPENTATLQIQFASPPSPGIRIYFPNDSTTVCYQEAGNLLMFETFEATGWWQLDKVDGKGRWEGNLELNLVNPHHNFSNSDFHHVEGAYRLAPQSID